MAEEIAFENNQISNFQGLMTLGQVILHTVVHHSTYMPISLTSKKLFVDGRMDGHLRLA